MQGHPYGQAAPVLVCFDVSPASKLVVMRHHLGQCVSMQVMFVTQSFGLLLGTIVMVPKTAQTIASVVMLTFVLTGGYFVTSIPAWIGWLSESSSAASCYSSCLLLRSRTSSIHTCTCSVPF